MDILFIIYQVSLTNLRNNLSESNPTSNWKFVTLNKCSDMKEKLYSDTFRDGGSV